MAKLSVEKSITSRVKYNTHIVNPEHSTRLIENFVIFILSLDRNARQKKCQTHVNGKTNKWKSQKLVAVDLTASSLANINNYHKFCLFIKDKKSDLTFLVDNGVDVSIIVTSPMDKKISDFKLNATKGSEIKTYGTETLNLHSGFWRAASVHKSKKK